VLYRLAEARGDRWDLLQCSQALIDGEWRSLYVSRPLQDLSLADPWRYFIRSCSLTPVVPASEPLAEPGWPARFSINGLILLDHPDPLANPWDPPASAMGIVHRVVNTATGRLVEHASYDEFFRALKARLQSRSRATRKST